MQGTQKFSEYCKYSVSSNREILDLTDKIWKIDPEKASKLNNFWLVKINKFFKLESEAFLK